MLIKNTCQIKRIEATYQHTVLKYFASGGMTNASLRERFGMNDKQRSQISRLIKETLEKNKIKLKGPESNSDFSSLRINNSQKSGLLVDWLSEKILDPLIINTFLFDLGSENRIIVFKTDGQN